MVNLQFPSDLTEEELMLQTAYNKLKEKKKILQDLKTPKPEPERAPQAIKRPTEARNAREVVKKLIESGVIFAPKTPKNPEQLFKRPRGLERKLSSTEKTVSSYQPFTETHQPEGKPQAKRPKVNNLYDSFVSSTNPKNKVVKEPKGNTIFVYGRKLSDDLLKEHFSVFGNIIRITMENERKGFITFEERKSAEEAIVHMDGTTVASSIELQVAIARKQQVFNPMNDISSSTMWSLIAARNARSGSYVDQRDVQVYEDDIFE